MDRISLTPPELYGNIGYTNSIVERIPISIYLTGDTTTNGGLLIPNQSGSGYRADLGDVVNIDRVTDVFLDSFISYKTRPMKSWTDASNNSHTGTGIYILGIKEFDIKTVSNNALLKNKVLIPNTAPTPTGDNMNDIKTTTLHRASKFNYIGTITPKKINELTITLTSEDEKTLSAGTGDGENGDAESKVWINFILIPRKE